MFWLAEVDIFRFDTSFVARFTSREAGASPRRDGTQNPQFRFHGRCWCIPTSSCTERWLVFNSVYQSNAAFAFCFVVGFVYIGQVTGTPWRQRLPVRRAFSRHECFPRCTTRVFSKMHKASVLPPKKQSVLIDPRYILLMLRPQLGHAIRRLRLVLNRPPVVCEQDFGAPCSIDWVLVGNIYNDSLRYCAPGDNYDGPCADQAFSFDGWPSERKVYWEQLCSSEWPCISRLRVLHVLCMLGWQRFVVQGVNGLFCCLSRWLERRR